MTNRHVPQYPADVVLRWDVASWLPALQCWERRVAGRVFDRGLEVGAREGGISLWLADRCREVVCSDVYGIGVAMANHAALERTGIRYEEIDARAIPYRDAFDVIAFRSVIGAVGGMTAIGARGIADQQRAFQEIHAALRRGGLLLFAENLSASPLHRFLRRRFVGWSASWRYVALNEMRSFLEPFSDVELHATGVLATLGRTEWQRTLLAHADRGLVNRVTPPPWRYIAYGAAVK